MQSRTQEREQGRGVPAEQHELLCQSIGRRHRLRVHYEGGVRVVEPFCYGIGKHGQPLLRAWQVRGQSRTAQTLGWKLFRVDRIRLLEDTGARFYYIRPGYNPDDSVMVHIDARV